MNYVQLNEYQVQTLKGNSGGDIFVQLVPDALKDGIMHQLWKQNTANTEVLVQEGLMEELKKEGDEFVAKMEKESGRTYRLFQVSKMGKAMFKPVFKYDKNRKPVDVSEVIN